MLTSCMCGNIPLLLRHMDYMASSEVASGKVRHEAGNCNCDLPEGDDDQVRNE